MKETLATLLRNYVRARDELLTYTHDLGCDIPAGQTLGAGVQVYTKPGLLRKLFHVMVDDGHIDYVVDMWSPFGRKTFNTLEDASSYLAEHNRNDPIYEVGKIGGIDVFSLYFKHEVLEILKEEEAE